MAETTTTSIARPAPYLEAAGQSYLDLLTKRVGQAPTAQELTAMSPQVAGQNQFTQAAQQQAARQAGLGSLSFDPTTGSVTNIAGGTGIAGYQPFLDQAAAYTGPNAYQQFMSPYQQDVIDTTLSEFDRQRQIQQQQIGSQAVQQGAFGGAREGIQQAEFSSQSLQDRSALEAQLRQQGFQQANILAGQAFGQQGQLATLQPTLAGQQIQQLGGMGTQNLSYQQAVLDAQRQSAQFQYQEPFTRLQALGSGIGGLLAGYPQPGFSQSSTPQQQVSPLSTALSAGAGVYGLSNLFGRG